MHKAAFESFSLKNLPNILALQLFLVFFVPPLQWHNRSFYAGDAWCVIWLFWTLKDALPKLDPELKEQLFRKFAISAVALFVIYLHGYFRPEIAKTLDWASLNPGEDRFSPVREAIVAIRFLSWIWAGIWVSILARIAPPEWVQNWMGRVARVTVSTVILLGVLALLSRAFPALADLLGWIYGYDPHSSSWSGRAHLTFRSPNETGVALTFAVLLVLFQKSLSNGWKSIATIFGLVGALLTQATTPLVGWALCVGAKCFSGLRPRQKLLSILAVVFATPSILLMNHSWVAFLIQVAALKLGHFEGRIQPWIVYLKTGVSRLDYLVVGTGFHSLHADNFFIYLFSRGGLLLTIGFFWAIVRVKRFDLIVAFLLITCLSLDSLILRPVVALLLALGIPTIESQRNQLA
jgi:hypothetical protein